MKLKTLLLMGLISASMVACSLEDPMTSYPQPPTSHLDVLRIEVTDAQEEQGTRTTYAGFTTTFEDNDAIGVYAVDASGNIKASNAKYIKSGAVWISTTNVAFNPEWKYYAYYPYVASPYTPDFSATDVDEQFSSFITDASNKFHKTDQSSKANYAASDLMIGQGTLSESNKVFFSMYHKKALILLSDEEVSTVSPYIPYTLSGQRRFHVKPGNVFGAGMDVVESGQYYDYNTLEYLTFTAVESGTFSFSTNMLSYSLDGGNTWTDLDAGGSTPTVSAGRTILWKKNNEGMNISSSSGMGSFSATGSFDAKGNIMSIVYREKFATNSKKTPNSYQFISLFYQNDKIRKADCMVLPATRLANSIYRDMFERCTGLVTAPKLPATQLSTNCYAGMFERCTSLTSAPALPATTLAELCYQNMFLGCTGLSSAPALPATTLARQCYISMFNSCTGLTVAPALPSTTLAEGCYQNMFQGCSRLTTPPALPATTLASGCYGQMFDNCSSLTTAPELPATQLVDYCYRAMFTGCSNLNYIKAAFTTEPSDSYTQNWVQGVKSTGTFVKNSAATWDVTGANGVPSGWTVTTYTP